MPALKKLGDELGLSMENGLAGVTSNALGHEDPKPDASEDTEAEDAKPLN